MPVSALGIRRDRRSIAAASTNITTSGAKTTRACHVMGSSWLKASPPHRGRGLTAHRLLLSEFQRPRTLVPTVPMTAIAVTTIRPAISAYSSTSPPVSSRNSFRKRAQALLIQFPLRCRWARLDAARRRRSTNGRGWAIAHPAEAALHAAVERVPAGQHLGANRADDGDCRHHDKAGHQGVLENFAALLIFHEPD